MSQENRSVAQVITIMLITFAIFHQRQYLGLNKENAESLASLFSSQHLVREQIPAECKLRNDI